MQEQGKLASMKVPPKRKGNQVFDVIGFENNAGLNESPSEKEGKLMDDVYRGWNGDPASMKVPPKRKGNEK